VRRSGIILLANRRSKEGTPGKQDSLVAAEMGAAGAVLQVWRLDTCIEQSVYRDEPFAKAIFRRSRRIPLP